ncbi:MAG TPA: response regulator [Draconibacterium sp.]|nr:response regulator [Draconibacterium sp.]
MKKILAIEDNEINMELLFHIINQHYPDFIFLKAFNGTTGIELAKKEKPEIILLDILMPGLNGYEVCEILKKDNTTSHIPVIMISALGGNPDERTKGLNAGADAFISKPYTVSELQAQINVALRIKGVEDLLRKRNESLELSIKAETNKYLHEEERILQISEHARQFYWEADKTGEIIYVSPVIESILNIKPLDILGKINFSELFQTDKNNPHLQLSEKSEIKEAEIELKVGKSKLWFAFSSFPLFDKKQKYARTRGICFDITKRKKAEIAILKHMKQIRQYQKKLKKLNVEITQVEERERHRIAENLHDSLGQTLSLAYLKLSAIDNQNFQPDTRKKIEEIFNLLNKAINESRELTYDLSPPILYELGLLSTFKWRLEQFEHLHNIQTQLIDGNVNLNLKNEIAIFIYRIVNELLQNILKHARATEIILEIAQKNNKYIISVHDNGVGFDTEKQRSGKNPDGFGLLSIKERLESFKGHFYIKSKPGVGTKAMIEIPVKNS